MDNTQTIQYRHGLLAPHDSNLCFVIPSPKRAIYVTPHWGGHRWLLLLDKYDQFEDTTTTTTTTTMY